MTTPLDVQCAFSSLPSQEFSVSHQMLRHGTTHFNSVAFRSLIKRDFLLLNLTATACPSIHYICLLQNIMCATYVYQGSLLGLKKHILEMPTKLKCGYVKNWPQIDTMIRGVGFDTKPPYNETTANILLLSNLYAQVITSFISSCSNCPS